MKTVLRLLAQLVGLAVLVVLFFYAVMLGSNAFDFFFRGPWTPPVQAQAVLTKVGDVDLAGANLDDFKTWFGEPEYSAHSDSEVNVQEYRWARGAVRVRTVDDTPIRIEIGASRTLEFLPFDRPRFLGSFLGLRIGDPAPDIASAAALRQKAKACCDVDRLNWRTFLGRVVGIDYLRSVERIKVDGPPKQQG